jgi:hypothetical protein
LACGPGNAFGSYESGGQYLLCHWRLVARRFPSYVERQADKELFDGLMKGEFCYVLTSRQMGKSSLMVRTAQKLRQHDISVISLDLTGVGQNLTVEQWYDGLLVRAGRQLRVEDAVEDFWMGHPRLGPCQRFFATFAEVVLPRLKSQATARGDPVRLPLCGLCGRTGCGPPSHDDRVIRE